MSDSLNQSKAIFNLWPLKMIWRERRREFRTLVVFVFSIFTGVAAVVISLSVSETVQRAIDARAKTLIGADLRLSRRDPFPPTVREVITQSKASFAEEVQFRTMAGFDGGTKLVQVRAIRGHYPFLGELESTPPGVWERVRSGALSGAIVDETLLMQLGASVGERVEVGGARFEIVAALHQAPGDSAVGYLFAPRIFLALDALPPSFLEAKGALSEYATYLDFATPNEEAEFLRAQTKFFEESGVEVTTLEKRRAVFGRVNENLSLFFDLLAVIALALGAVGGGAGVLSYLQGKRREIAVLKCLGATTGDIRAFLLGQIVLATTVAILFGVLLGSALGVFLLASADDLIRFGLSFQLSPRTIGVALLLGYGSVVLFAAPTLRKLGGVPPLEVFRPGHSAGLRVRDFLGVGALFFAGAIFLLTGGTGGGGVSLRFAAVAGGVLLLFTVLFAGGAAVLKAVLQNSTAFATSLSLRLGVLRIARPGNRTTLFTVAIGGAAFLIFSVVLASTQLQSQIRSARGETVANLFVFDIQPDQEEEARRIFAESGTPIEESVPIVLMRIDSLNGRPVSQLIKEGKIPDWTIRRDYWSTYRENLIDNEKIVDGEWIGRVPSDTEVIPISIEDELAKRLDLKVGSEIVWDIQGVTVKTRVASLRDIYWEQMRRNAFIVFPAGVLEEAPRFLFFTARTGVSESSGSESRDARGGEKAAALQRLISQRLPNVTIVDLRSVVTLFEEILSRMSHAVVFLTLLVTVTGFFVVLAITLSGAAARREEGVYLRTLGATKREVSVMLLTESGVLALGSVVVGGGAALLSGWAFARYGMKVPFVIDGTTALSLLSFGGAIIFVAMFLSIWGNRKMITAPCFEALRSSS